MLYLRIQTPLAQYTTLNIGGPARLFLTVKSEKEFTQALNFSLKENIPYLLIGGGSNLLIADEGFPGVAIKNEFKGIEISQKRVIVKSGTILQDLVDQTIKLGLSGLQKLAGIPGTLGGALYGNAGAYGQTISDYLEKVVCINPDNLEKTILTKKECNFKYRDSIFKKNHLVVIEAHFKFLASEEKNISKEVEEILIQRTIKYPPTLKCPGSFFKNILLEKVSPGSLKLIPEEKITYHKIPAGYLLEAVGSKGQKLGDIEVSSSHANLFINTGDGKAIDFFNLAKQEAQKVKEKFNIILEPEVQLINLPKIF